MIQFCSISKHGDASYNVLQFHHTCTLKKRPMGSYNKCKEHLCMPLSFLLDTDRETIHRILSMTILIASTE